MRNEIDTYYRPNNGSLPEYNYHNDKMVITIPSIMYSIPITIASICSFALLAKKAPATPLPAALIPVINPGRILILPWRAYPNAPEQAVIVMRSDEVPIAI